MTQDRVSRREEEAEDDDDEHVHTLARDSGYCLNPREAVSLERSGRKEDR